MADLEDVFDEIFNPRIEDLGDGKYKFTDINGDECYMDFNEDISVVKKEDMTTVCIGINQMLASQRSKKELLDSRINPEDLKFVQEDYERTNITIQTYKKMLEGGLK